MCPGYGWSAGTVCNEIDFERKVYVQRVGSVDLGTLSWEIYNADRKIFRASVPGIAIGEDTIFPNIITARYKTVMGVDSWATGIISTSKIATNRVFICDTAYTDTTSFKAAMSGVLLYYELAKPIEIDLSDVLPDDHFIEVEAGGTVTFKQASTQLPVPSEITYQISTSEVIANA